MVKWQLSNVVKFDYFSEPFPDEAASVPHTRILQLLIEIFEPQSTLGLWMDVRVLRATLQIFKSDLMRLLSELRAI